MVLAALALSYCSSVPPSKKGFREMNPDPYLWLEEVESPRALDWVRDRSAHALAVLTGGSRSAAIEKEVRKVTLAKDRIAFPDLRSGWVYNFWQDEKHVRGLWRRVKFEEYSHPQPRWEVVLDLDELARAEKENWVWAGARFLPPGNQLALILLSRGGKDAAVTREFDVERKGFVSGGFELPEAKGGVTWIDHDRVLVATSFGKDSVTASGYPRIIKLWKRGQPLSEALKVFECQVKDVMASAFVSFRPEGNVTLLERRHGFFEQERFVLEGDLSLRKVPVPDSAESYGLFNGELILQLREDWESNGKNFTAGSLVAFRLNAPTGSSPSLIWSPDQKSAIQSVVISKDRMFVSLLENVQARMLRFELSDSGHWRADPIEIGDFKAADFVASDSFDDRIVFRSETFLDPTALFSISSSGSVPKKLKELPRRFDPAGLKMSQAFATSRDGTKIPYFIVRKNGLKLDGTTPVILNGYGGFEISKTPYYLESFGNTWLEKGGAFVLANIRGGGEFGPRWHQAALLEHRQRAFDDFIAVAEDLVSQGVTQPKRLGIWGGSNGGLLVGAVLTQRSELFGAVVCEVPLLDMLRYTKLLAGASWMAEYGDPESPAMAKVLLKYSPYQNVKSHSAVPYPEALIMTSTQDDRVHPGHARKMAARLEELGQPVLYFENVEGGHGGAANLDQLVRRRTLALSYFFRRLVDAASVN